MQVFTECKFDITFHFVSKANCNYCYRHFNTDFSLLILWSLEFYDVGMQNLNNGSVQDEAFAMIIEMLWRHLQAGIVQTV